MTKKARHYSHTITEFYSQFWAILPAKLDVIEAALTNIVTTRSEDGWKAFDDNFDKIEEPKATQSSDIAVIPISGTISPRPSAFTSGGTSAESVGRSIDAAKVNSSVRNIVLNIDSPGGSVFGVEELAGKIRQAAAVKPVHAVANHMAASAAYWLGSQASTFAMAPSGQVGSIGVIYRRLDRSAAIQKDGVNVKYVHSGKFKSEGQPDTPITETEIADLQAKSDIYYEKFVADVAKGRKQSVSHVMASYGNGRMFLAEQAKALGMVDRVASFETIMSELQQRSSRGRIAKAACVSMAMS